MGAPDLTTLPPPDPSWRDPAVAPPDAPPSPRRRRKRKAPLLPTAGGALILALRIGLGIFLAQDDPPGENQPAMDGQYEAVEVTDAEIFDADEIALSNSACYDEGRREKVLCEDPHDGETVALLDLGRDEADPQTAFLRCLDAVLATLGELPEGTEVRAYTDSLPDSAGVRIVACGVEAVRGAPPLTGSLLD